MIPEHVGLRQIVQDLRDQPVERIRETLVGSALPHELEQAVAHSRAHGSFSRCLPGSSARPRTA